MRTATLDLQAPSIDEAPEGVLDPSTLPPQGAKVRIKPYDDMAYRDRVYLYVGGDYTDDIPIALSAVGQEVEFTVEARAFIASHDNIVPVRYEVQFYQGERKSSQTLALSLGEPFELEASLDLSRENYVIAVDKAPVQIPDYARMTRTADWGVAPYTYASSDSNIARVDLHAGVVTALRNGTITITATDSQGKPRSYALTIKGIQAVHFLSTGADWTGMNALCSAAKVQPVTVSQIRRLWTLYFPSSGPVADYLNWLNYPVWTGDVLGAGTAMAYELNGASVNDNASAHDVATFLQVVGLSSD